LEEIKKMSKFVKVMLLVAIGAIALLPGAKADQRNQKTVFTFSGPIEIPGQVLPGGTYVFKLADSPAHRHIVQVFSDDETRLFGTFLAIPDYRLRPSDKPIIKFDERAAGEPQAVKGWFYPGANYGHEFVYPKKEALALAKANNTPVPAMPSELAADTTKSAVSMDGPEVAALNTAPLTAEKPSGEEVEVGAVFLITESHSSTPHAELPETLPATATSLPLVGIIGLLSLGAAASLRYAPTRKN
jgi:hypothetical protein